MKLFKSADINTVEICQQSLLFHLPSDILKKRLRREINEIYW